MSADFTDVKNAFTAVKKAFTAVKSREKLPKGRAIEATAPETKRGRAKGAARGREVLAVATGLPCLGLAAGLFGAFVAVAPKPQKASRQPQPRNPRVLKTAKPSLPLAAFPLGSASLGLGCGGLPRSAFAAFYGCKGLFYSCKGILYICKIRTHICKIGTLHL